MRIFRKGTAYDGSFSLKNMHKFCYNVHVRRGWEIAEEGSITKEGVEAVKERGRRNSGTSEGAGSAIARGRHKIGYDDGRREKPR